MAKVVQKDDRHLYRMNNWIRVTLTGAGLGVIILALTWVLGQYVIDPLVCRGGALESCNNSNILAGNVAAVIGAIAGASVLIRLRVYRGIFVAIATLISFWGIGALTEGLRWAEVAAWMAALYGFGYLLFAHILRIRRSFVAFIVAAIAVLVLRWVAFL